MDPLEESDLRLMEVQQVMNADEWSEIHRCHREGESIKSIALRLGMSRNTVRRALSLARPPDDHRRRSGRITDEIDTQLRGILLESPRVSIAEIGRRVGWARSRTTLARKVQEIRDELESARQESERVAAGVPTPATSFIGRRRELRELRRLLGEHRLLSIVGPGGIGKTRLSIQAAYEFRRAFPDGVRFVEFAAVRAPTSPAQLVCDCLALDNHVAHNRSPEDALVDYLRNRRMLLVLDNCEHLVDPVARLVNRLLETTTALRIVTTTREHLSIPGEYVFNLLPLPTRDESGSGAIELFAARAAAVLSGFEITDADTPAIERICERLDGLPLAIELACARLTVLSIEDLSELLDHRLSVLAGGTRGRVPRHRSLQATIDWSYDLCTDRERALWARLSVFADGFDLPMALAVCADDTLPPATIMDTVSALVTKSVVRREERGGPVRFHMLESIREYGQGRLTPAERRHLRTKLLSWCVSTIDTVGTHWYGAGQSHQVRSVEYNRGNFRAALAALMAGPAEAGVAAEVAAALGSAPFLWACGISVREHRMWLTRVLDLPGVPAATKARVLAVLGLVQVLQGDRESAEFSLHRAREIAHDLAADPTSALIANVNGLREMFAGDLDAARAHMDEAAVRYSEHGSPPDLVAMLRVHQGMLYSAAGDVAGARPLFESVHTGTSAADERWFHSYATYGLGLVALLDGDFPAARDLATRGLRIQQTFSDVVGTTLLTELLGWASAALDTAARAAVLLGAASAMWGSIGQQLYGSRRWIELRADAIETAREQIGPDAFERNWDKGRSMSISDLTAFIFDESAPPRPGSRRPPQRGREQLTPREQEVAEYIAAGMTNRQIAEKLVLSTRTVEGHVEHVLRKLGAQRRVELAARTVF